MKDEPIKLKIEDLKIQSFVTALRDYREEEEQESGPTVSGGACFTSCCEPSFPDTCPSPCT